MNEQEWATCLAPISDDLYETLFNETGCGPFDGGCVLVAQALQQVMGGDVVVLVRASSGVADHAAVFFDDMLWDFDGPLQPTAFIERFEKNELACFGAQCGGFRPIQTGDLEDAPRDDSLVGRLADIFRSVLPGNTPPPGP